MLKNWLRLKLELRRLRLVRETISQKCEDDIRAAKAERKSREEINGIRKLARAESDEARDEMRVLTTEYLLNLADSYSIPIPPRPSTEEEDSSPAWEYCGEFARFVLSPLGMKELRAEIRKERSERRRDWQGGLFWLTGLIGAITGLIAVWKK